MGGGTSKESASPRRVSRHSPRSATSPSHARQSLSCSDSSPEQPSPRQSAKPSSHSPGSPPAAPAEPGTPGTSPDPDGGVMDGTAAGPGGKKMARSSDFAAQIPTAIALTSLTSSPARLNSTSRDARSSQPMSTPQRDHPALSSSQSLSATSQRPSGASGVSQPTASQSPQKLVESSALFVPAVVKVSEDKTASRSQSIASASRTESLPTHVARAESNVSASSSLLASTLFLSTQPKATTSGDGAHPDKAARASTDSRSSLGTQSYSGLGSSTLDARSSFALERAELNTRPSLEMFGLGGNTQIWDPAEAAAAEQYVASFPPDLLPFIRDLACFPAQSVCPISLFTQLWGVSEHETRVLCERMVALSIVKCTTLANGASWCLISDHLLNCIKHVFSLELTDIHAKMLAVYETRPNFTSFVDTPDDGYIVMNIAHHLVGAKRGKEIRHLLMSPDWLEIKLHNYGAAAVVDDFKQSLLVDEEHRSFTKLLLQAYQMSVSNACLNMPHAGTLKAQMVARLMLVAQSGSDLASDAMLEWWHERRRELLRPIDEAFERVEMAEAASTSVKLHPVHLLPLTASLGQAGGFQRMVLQGHADAVVGVLLSDSMTHIITISTDATARVWDLEVGTCQHVLQYTAPLTQLYSVGTGTLFMTLSTDSAAVVWDYMTGKLKYRLTGHVGRVLVATIHPRGSTAVTCGEDGTCRMYNLQTGQCEMIMSGHKGAILDIDIEWEVADVFDGPMAITGGEDFRACIWDLLADSEDPPVSTLTGHAGWVTSVQMIEQGRRCVTASHDGTAKVWDTPTGACVATLSGHTGRINKVVVHKRDQIAITCSDDFTCIVWDLNTCVATQVLKGHTGWVNKVIFMPDTEGVKDVHAVTISGDDLAMVWNCETGEVLRVVDGHSGEITCCCLSARGRFLLTGSKDSTCRVWDLASSFNKNARPHRGGVNVVVPFSLPRSVRPAAPNDLETAVFTVGASGVVCRWDTAALASSRSVDTKISFLWASATSDRSRLITCAGNRHICTWDAHAFSIIDELPAVTGSRVKHCAISGNGRRVVTVLFDSSITVWDLEERACVWQPQKRGERDHRRVHSGGVNAVYITEDGRLAVTVSKDHTARIWDLDQHTCCGLLTGHTDSVVSGFLAPDGSHVLTCSADATAKLWDTQSGNCLMSLVHKVGVERVVCSEDLQWALTSCASSRAWLWDLRSGQCSAVLKVKQSSKITGGCFSLDSRLAITCSKECHLAIWHTSTARLLAFYVAESAIAHCACLRNGVLVAAGANGDIHFLQLPQKRPGAVSTPRGSAEHPPERGADGCIVAKALSSNRKKGSASDVTQSAARHRP